MSDELWGGKQGDVFENHDRWNVTKESAKDGLGEIETHNRESCLVEG